MTPEALLLTPGAGSDRDHPTLRALDDGLDLDVARVDFPYRKEGRRAPDRAPKLIQCVRDEADALVERTGVAPDRVLYGGRSMGGRMCSMAVAEGLPAAGLVLLSYPLHPSGKPEKLRVDHFGDIAVPCLFVSGDRDAFGTPDEFAEHLPGIAGEVTVEWLPGARHDAKGHDEAIVEIVARWIAGLG